jgi:mRNA interferase MazF
MGAFVKGGGVVAPCPFSDLRAAKKCLVLVVAPLTENDVILCQMTSQAAADSYAALLIDGDFGKPITKLIWPVVAES